MITVELRRRPEGEEEQSYQCVAVLSVRADGTYELHDPEGLFPLSLHVLAPGDGGEITRVTFQDDPAAWARNLSSLLRAGYLVPVITRDDEAPAAESAPAPPAGVPE